MAELFQTSSDNISLHLKNIFADGELTETATTEDFSVVRQWATHTYTKFHKQSLQVEAEQGDKKDFEILAKQIPNQDKGRNK